MNTQNIKLPNFLIVGASKSGTSSLYKYLEKHPDIFFSDPKEPKYFVREKFIRPIEYLNLRDDLCESWGEYLNLFKEVDREHIVGEASVSYLYYHKIAIPRIINKLSNDTKIFIILRNPVDRAFSAYCHLRRDNLEIFKFKEALNKEDERKNEDKYIPLFFYKSVSLYHKQVKAYFDNFKNVKVCLFDDLINNRDKLFKDIFEFLEVNKNFMPSTKNKYNKSGVPKNKILHNFVNKPPKIVSCVSKIIPHSIKEKLVLSFNDKNLKKPKIKEETREYLKNYFREDILKTQDLINRDLSAWLK